MGIIFQNIIDEGIESSNIDVTENLETITSDNMPGNEESSNDNITAHEHVVTDYSDNISSNDDNTRASHVSVLNLSEDDSRSSSSDLSKKKKRKRSYDFPTLELQHTTKRRLTIPENLLPINDPARSLSPLSINCFNHLNFTWMLAHAIKIPKTPMWVGYNSLIRKETSLKQRISYLTTINSSPTDPAVVRETMRQSVQAADECGQRYMQVTYDLAIAKIALQIQANERDENMKNLFAKIFIHFGSFHIQLAYFKAIGKYIDNNGITNIMTDCEVLASGSVNGFIQGKHFNRCKRLHPMISLAIQILHFKSFLNTKNNFKIDEVKKFLQNFIEETSDNPTLKNSVLITLFDEYQDYKEKTLEGNHGKTPQYYMMYVKFIDYYLMLNFSIRTGDFDMFLYILPELAKFFFIFNQQNYARYLIKYHDNLLKVNDTHPGLREDFEKGSFGVKRTDKPFSRQPVDLTLEQTINADAANKLTGIKIKNVYQKLLLSYIRISLYLII